ncbi:adipocyte plasma membrane-associated protein-like [Ciona intestinalis]
MNDKQIRRRNVSAKPVSANESSKVGHSNRRMSHSNASCILSLLFCFCGCIFIAFVIGLFMCPFDTVVKIEDVVNVELKDAYAVNSLLSTGKKLHSIFPTPECIVEGKDKLLYTGLADGRVVCIHPSNDGEIGAGKVETITTGVIEGAVATTPVLGHGRPFGLRLVGETLYVADAIYGLYMVDVKTKKISILVSPDAVVPNINFADDLDITTDGNFIYFSDATKNQLTHYHLEVYSGLCSGRIFRYNLISKKLDMVITNLCFANGVQLSNNEHQLVVAETNRNRVTWYDIETWKPLHVVNLPFEPDNVRITDKGTYLVAGSGPFLRPMIKSIFFNFPLLRKSISGLLSVHALDTLYQAMYDESHCFLVELNNFGEVVNVMQSTDGRLAYAIASGIELSDGRIALGTWAADHMAIIDR